VAETAADARDVLVEGDSGILACHPQDFRPVYEPSKRRLTWPNGAMATLYNATEPDQLRGPQHDAAWSDELAKWAYARETWDMLQFGLRIGERPRQIVTTTPRPVPVVHELVKRAILTQEGQAPDVVITRGSTDENRANLAPSFLKTIVRRYEGTRLGRQELHAEILDDVPGALWTRAMLDECRISHMPEMQRIVVAIDPSGTRGDKGDMVGIVAAGRGVDGRGYVLADRSCRMSPAGWGKRAVTLYHELRADLIVAEKNFGGAMVEHVIKTADENVPYREVDASRGKVVRAEPIAALYEQKRVSHVGAFPQLEDQLVAFTPDGYVGEGSPDNADAGIWALTELMLGDDNYDWTYAWVGDASKIGQKAHHEPDDQAKAASLQRFRR
jgi:phage terminase large subunit-like protein